jgi:hypothetical protein
MSSIAPPVPYFSGINFNPAFFRSVYDYLTEQIANTLYLKLRGGSLSGNLGIKKSPANVELDMTGKINISGFSGIPTIGIYGGSGTKLILKEGITSISPPIALGVNGDNLWMGGNFAGNVSIYTGLIERMRIQNDGKVGIGTSSPNAGGLTTIYSDTQAQARLLLTGREYYTGATTSANGVALMLGVNRIDNKQLWICDSEKLAINNTNSAMRLITGGAGITSIDSVSTDSSVVFKLSLNNSIYIKGDGKVGIGNTDPGNIFQVGAGGRFKITNDTNDFTLIGTKDVEDNNNTKIVLSGYTRDAPHTGNIDYVSTVGGIHRFYTGGFNERMRISNNGNVGIANTNPDNILIVGDGSRFRISNGPTDYSAIGTKEVDDVNNTSILMYGYQHANALRKGCVEYVASTPTGTHDFYMNGSTAIAVSMTPDDFKISTSCSTYGFNYFTDGEYLNYEIRVNTSGIGKGGYFHTTEYFFNSFVVLACSWYDGTTYRYWYGHVGTNNSTQILFATPFSSSGLVVENFVEQTTNITYIYSYPNSAYGTITDLRIKFYG